MKLHRREFFGVSAGLVATGLVSGCASVATTRLAPAGGAIRLRPADYPQLTGAGGQLRIQPEGSPAPIYLLASGTGQYTAVSPICTHLGCTVNVEGALLVCPCHGSTYNRAGEVMRGPAERPLRRYPVELTSDGQVVIRMEEP